MLDICVDPTLFDFAESSKILLCIACDAVDIMAFKICNFFLEISNFNSLLLIVLFCAVVWFLVAYY